MAKKLALAALCLVLLTGCGGFSLTLQVEDLLEAPRLNRRQAEVYQALEATGLDVSSIQYRYPQRGEHRSPFVFYDLDGDDSQEAIAFYVTQGDESTVQATILKTDELGGWYSYYDLTAGSGNDQVEFVRFAHLLSADWPCMVIGWQNTRRGSTTLGIYSFEGGHYQEDTTLTVEYHSYDIDDYVGDSLQELALVALDDEAYRLLLFGKTTDGRLGSLGDIPLSQDVNSVLQLKRGRLWNGRWAVYVDELRTDTLYATEIIGVEQSGLSMIVGETADMANYMTTRRGEPLLCVDLSGDGYLDIPTTTDLPWVLESGELVPPKLIEYIRIQPDESFAYSTRAVRNEEAGYIFFLPDHWISEDNMVQVTVLLRPESNEWRFYKIDPDFDTATVELLRLQVYSTRDYRDQFIQGFVLAEKGLFEYYGYIPRTADEDLAVSEDQVRAHFFLLESE